MFGTLYSFKPGHAKKGDRTNAYSIYAQIFRCEFSVVDQNMPRRYCLYFM